jgi:hypothetical protein
MVVRRDGDAGGGATAGSSEAADGAAEVCGDAVERIAVGRGGEAGSGAGGGGEAADGGTAVDACGDAGSSGGIGSDVGVGEVGITGGV